MHVETVAQPVDRPHEHMAHGWRPRLARSFTGRGRCPTGPMAASAARLLRLAQEERNDRAARSCEHPASRSSPRCIADALTLGRGSRFMAGGPFAGECIAQPFGALHPPMASERDLAQAGQWLPITTSPINRRVGLGHHNHSYRRQTRCSQREADPKRNGQRSSCQEGSALRSRPHQSSAPPA